MSNLLCFTQIIIHNIHFKNCLKKSGPLVHVLGSHFQMQLSTLGEVLYSHTYLLLPLVDQLYIKILKCTI